LVYTANIAVAINN